MERPADVDREHPLPVLRGDIQKQLLLCNAGVVDKQVHAAEVHFGKPDEPGSVGGIGYVGLYGAGAAAFILQRLCKL